MKIAIRSVLSAVLYVSMYYLMYFVLFHPNMGGDPLLPMVFFALASGVVFARVNHQKHLRDTVISSSVGAVMVIPLLMLTFWVVGYIYKAANPDIRMGANVGFGIVTLTQMYIVISLIVFFIAAYLMRKRKMVK